MHQRLAHFIEEMGLFFESEGMPRIAGRLFAYMLLQEEPCSLDDLTTDLKVSKTSVSTNARLLEQHGMIQRVARPGDRRDYYVAAPNQTRTIELRLEGVRRMARLLEEAEAGVPKDRHHTHERLAQMLSINQEIIGLLGDILARHGRTEAGPPRPEPSTVRP